MQPLIDEETPLETLMKTLSTNQVIDTNNVLKIFMLMNYSKPL